MLCIKTVNGVPAPQTKPDATHVTISPISVEMGADRKLTVQGTGFTEGVVCCTLVRLGMSAKEKRESMWRAARFVNRVSTSKDGS